MKAPWARVGRWASPRRRLRAGITQLLFACAGLAGALLLVDSTEHVGPQAVSSRMVDMLVALGVGVLSVSTVVFSLLVMVVQWASGNLTPRLSLFRDDPSVWRTFAYIVAVFVFCLTAALAIGRHERTSALVAAVAAALSLLAMGLIRRLQLKAFASIQLAPVLAEVTRRGLSTMRDLHALAVPTSAGWQGFDGEGSRTVVWPGPAGALQQVHALRLVEAAVQAQAVVMFRQQIGAWLMTGAPVCEVSGDRLADKAILQHVVVGPERTPGQDPLFPVRLVADIGLRALSAAINDPATAVQALDRLHELLLTVVGRDLDTVCLSSNDGRPRLVIPLPSLEDFLSTGLDDIIAARGPLPMVSARLRALLEDLHAKATDRQRPAVAARLARL